VRTRLILSLAVLLGVTGFAPAPLPRRSRDASEPVTLQRMHGVWQVVSMWCYGYEGRIATHITAWKSMSIRDGKWEFCYGADGDRVGSSWELSVKAGRPARLDFIWAGERRVAMSGVVRSHNGLLEVLYQTSPLDHGSPVAFDKPPANFYLIRLKKIR
jgi:hypothetical protein